jgi:hypothetical protein
MANFIETDMLPVGKYLANAKAIRVPEYQRSYAWTDDEVSQLWQDLIDSLTNQRQEYFIGPIVVKRTGAGEVELIDGQQRLSTILIIISVIRALFRANGDAQRADLLSNKFFGERDILTLQTNEKFIMNEENGAAFRDVVSREVGLHVIKKEQVKYNKKHSNHLLIQAYLTVFELLNKYTDGQFRPEQVLAVFTYLTDSIKVLILSVDDEADAYTIFETLNDRGRSLDTLDLLKNHLFAKAKLHLPEVKQKWAAVKENLLEADPKNRFLHHLWTSINGRTSTTGLFRAIRDDLTTAKQAVDFSNMIAEGSRVYAALQNSSSSYWDEHSAETRKNIGILRLLDAQQALPILLAAESQFDKEEFRKLTRLLVVMAVRYNFIGEERTGVAANYYSEIPRPIRQGVTKKAAHVFRSLKPIYPGDDSFKDAFKAKSISDTKRARYLLAEMENTISSAEKIVNSDPEEVNLEHIMPKAINQHWQPEDTRVTQDEHRYFVNRIGNLALVPKEKNKKVGSKSFADKKKELFSRCEAFETTASICRFETWDRSAIEQRQAELAEHAVKTWRYEGE